MTEYEFEKAYKTSVADYSVKVRASKRKGLATVDLFSIHSQLPLWSTLEPSKNHEKLADAMFRSYCKHIENESANNIS